MSLRELLKKAKEEALAMDREEADLRFLPKNVRHQRDIKSIKEEIEKLKKEKRDSESSLRELQKRHFGSFTDFEVSTLATWLRGKEIPLGLERLDKVKMYKKLLNIAEKPWHTCVVRVAIAHDCIAKECDIFNDIFKEYFDKYERALKKEASNPIRYRNEYKSNDLYSKPYYELFIEKPAGEEFLTKYSDFWTPTYWSIISQYQKFSVDFVRKFEGKLDFNAMFISRNVDEEIYNEFKHKIDLEVLKLWNPKIDKSFEDYMSVDFSPYISKSVLMYTLKEVPVKIQVLQQDLKAKKALPIIEQDPFGRPYNKDEKYPPILVGEVEIKYDFTVEYAYSKSREKSEEVQLKWNRSCGLRDDWGGEELPNIENFKNPDEFYIRVKTLNVGSKTITTHVKKEQLDKYLSSHLEDALDRIIRQQYRKKLYTGYTGNKEKTPEEEIKFLVPCCKSRFFDSSEVCKSYNEIRRYVSEELIVPTLLDYIRQKYGIKPIRVLNLIRGLYKRLHESPFDGWGKDLGLALFPKDRYTRAIDCVEEVEDRIQKNLERKGVHPSITKTLVEAMKDCYSVSNLEATQRDYNSILDDYPELKKKGKGAAFAFKGVWIAAFEEDLAVYSFGINFVTRHDSWKD